MAFEDLPLVPRGPRRAADKVTVSIVAAKNNQLTLRVIIGGTIAERLSWTKGQRVDVQAGKEGTAARGCLSMAPNPNGRFTLSGSGATLRLETRVLHPTWIAKPMDRQFLTPVQIAKERLVVKLPPAMLTPPTVGQIMGDEHRRRA